MMASKSPTHLLNRLLNLFDCLAQHADRHQRLSIVLSLSLPLLLYQLPCYTRYTI
jgi:hypothetical protein